MSEKLGKAHLIKNYKDHLQDQYMDLDDNIQLFQDTDNLLERDFAFNQIKKNLWNINQFKETLKTLGYVYDYADDLEEYIVKHGVILNEYADLYGASDEDGKNRVKERNFIIESGIYHVLNS